jgi:hypothetical protein
LTHDLRRCARLYEAAARQSKFSDKVPELLYSAARCDALDGDLAAAYSHLRMSIDAGWIDIKTLEAHPDLVSLRADGRWPGLLDAIRARRERRLTELNGELLAASGSVAQPVRRPSAGRQPHRPM